MIGQSTGVRVGVWIAAMLFQAAIAYLIALLMQRQTINKVIVLMEALKLDEQISRRQFQSDSHTSSG